MARPKAAPGGLSDGQEIVFQFGLESVCGLSGTVYINMNI